MRVPITTALRAELSRAREKQGEAPLALFLLGLGDEGDLPAWALAVTLAPERIGALPPPAAGLLIAGAAPLADLARTLQKVGERELSDALRRARFADVPVVLVHDVVRVVKPLEELEFQEAEMIVDQKPAGSA
jgi:hypothetical protein